MAEGSSSSRTALLQEFCSIVKAEGKSGIYYTAWGAGLLPKVRHLLGLPAEAELGLVYQAAKAQLDERSKGATLPRSHNASPGHAGRSGRGQKSTLHTPRSASHSREIPASRGGGGLIRPLPPPLPQPLPIFPQGSAAACYNVPGAAVSRRREEADDDSSQSTNTSTLVEDAAVKKLKTLEKERNRRSRESSSHSRHRQHRHDKENRSGGGGSLHRLKPSLGKSVVDPEALSERLQLVQLGEEAATAAAEDEEDNPLSAADRLREHDLPDDEEDELKERRLGNPAWRSTFQTSLTTSLPANPGPKAPPPPLPASASPHWRRAPQDPSPTPPNRVPLPPPHSAPSPAPLQVLFTVNDDETPFATLWKRPREELTLAAFKAHVLPARYRDAELWHYYFQCLWNGTEVRLDICDPEERLPLAKDGKLRARIESRVPSS